MPKRDSLWTHLVIVALVALGLYALSFSWLEHRRVRQGPWEVTFIQPAQGSSRIRIDQAALGITNVQVELGYPTTNATVHTAVRFVPGQTVPFEVPFGECIFMDPLFLPGTVTLKLFDHRLELLPRALVVDGEAYPWEPEMSLHLMPPETTGEAGHDDADTARQDIQESRK